MFRFNQKEEKVKFPVVEHMQARHLKQIKAIIS